MQHATGLTTPHTHSCLTEEGGRRRRRQEEEEEVAPPARAQDLVQVVAEAGGARRLLEGKGGQVCVYECLYECVYECVYECARVVVEGYFIGPPRHETHGACPACARVCTVCARPRIRWPRPWVKR
jgi:hypothetical protein